MDNTKTELWNGHEIRFIEKTPGDWWAVAADVTDALGISNTSEAVNGNQKKNAKGLAEKDRGICKLYTTSEKAKARKTQDVLVVSENGIYKLAFRSNKPEAEEFQDWVFSIIKALRQASGLEGFEIFRMLDKEHQKEAMKRLQDGLRKPVKVDYIKANTIANKAVSSLFGYPKMIKKDEMTPEILVSRQSILDDTVNLMAVNESFGLGISVSETIYSKYTDTLH